MTDNCIIYTIRYLKGDAWVSHWNDTPVACGHEDQTPDETADPFLSAYDCADAICEALDSDASIDDVCVWCHGAIWADMTQSVMALARGKWIADAKKLMRKGKMDCDGLTDAMPRAFIAHGIDDLIAEMIREAGEETAAIDAEARAYRRSAR